MKRLHSWGSGKLGFIAGFVIAGVLFGGLGLADSVAKQITVYYRPLRYVFDGTPKEPPADQLGFIYDGRTFVSLRFISEALGKKVEWDGETGTIYLGRRPVAVPDFWSDFVIEGSGTIRTEYFRTDMFDLAGDEMMESLVVTMVTLQQSDTEQTVLSKTFTVPDGANKLTGKIFLPDYYLYHKDAGRTARLTLLDERNRVLFQSDTLDPADYPTAQSVEVPLTGIEEVRMFLTLFMDGGIPESSGFKVQVGLSDFRFE